MLACGHVFHHGTEKILHSFGKMLRLDQIETADLAPLIPADDRQFITRTDLRLIPQLLGKHHLPSLVHADDGFNLTTTHLGA